jgi:hypothetical protein
VFAKAIEKNYLGKKLKQHITRPISFVNVGRRLTRVVNLEEHIIRNEKETFINY